MEPVTVTITDPYELAGWQRARCYSVAAEISDLADDVDIGNIIQGADSERMPELLSQLEAALAALQAIDRR